MNTNPKLPDHIGGFQHLAPDVICQAGDIYVRDGKPSGLVEAYIGLPVLLAEKDTGSNIYRRIPCPRQGGERTDDDSLAKLSEEMRSRLVLPADAKARKAVPIYSGFIKYFPRAIAAVARLSQVGNDQHNPGQPLHWDRSKSGDELDALMRHLLEAGNVDHDGVLHDVKVAWRAMAALEKRLEKQEGGR